MASRLPRERCFRRSPAGEKVMVGVGIEPTTFGSSDRRCYHLSYPTKFDVRGEIRTPALRVRSATLLVPLSYTDKVRMAGIEPA